MAPFGTWKVLSKENREKKRKEIIFGEKKFKLNKFYMFIQTHFILKIFKIFRNFDYI